MLSERLAIYLYIYTCMHGRSQFLTKQPDLLTRTPYSLVLSLICMSNIYHAYRMYNILLKLTRWQLFHNN